MITVTVHHSRIYFEAPGTVWLFSCERSVSVLPRLCVWCMWCACGLRWDKTWTQIMNTVSSRLGVWWWYSHTNILRISQCWAWWWWLGWCSSHTIILYEYYLVCLKSTQWPQTRQAWFGIVRYCSRCFNWRRKWKARTVTVVSCGGCVLMMRNHTYQYLRVCPHRLLNSSEICSHCLYSSNRLRYSYMRELKSTIN